MTPRPPAAEAPAVRPLTGYPPTVRTEELERHLGPGGPLPPEAAARADAADLFPQAAVDALDSFGLYRSYVPERYGGGLRDYPTTAALIRAVAARDLTVAVAHGKTFLGAVCVWVAGTEEQARRLADRVLAGVPVSWGLTEREHGSDLVAGELAATGDGPRLRLDGEKWLINNATRCGLVTVLARTDEAGGPRGFGVFLVDREAQDRTSYRPLPKVRTLGIRGADISGFELRGATVDPVADQIGAPGTGLETVMRSLQLTRTVCATLSLGAGDRALSEAAAFADYRELYGRGLLDLPAARRTLTEAYADQLLHEAFATVAIRSIHTLPGELAVTAAAVKYLVPVRTEAMLARLRRLLGARGWLRDVRAGERAGGAGIFQKVERDHRIVSLFDGNTVVNLNSLISQFPLLARAHRAGREAAPGLAAAADLTAALPPADYRALRLMPTRGSSLLHALPGAARQLAELADEDPLLAPAAAAADRLARHAEELLTEIAGQPIVPPDVPAYAFTLARRLTHCLAGAAAVALWLGHHRTAAASADPADPGCPAPLWRHGRWLHAALDRVLTDIGPTAARPDPPRRDDAELDALDEAHRVLGEVLLAQVRAHRLTSLLPVRLAAPERADRTAPDRAERTGDAGRDRAAPVPDHAAPGPAAGPRTEEGIAR